MCVVSVGKLFEFLQPKEGGARRVRQILAKTIINIYMYREKKTRGEKEKVS